MQSVHMIVVKDRSWLCVCVCVCVFVCRTLSQRRKTPRWLWQCRGPEAGVACSLLSSGARGSGAVWLAVLASASCSSCCWRWALPAWSTAWSTGRWGCVYIGEGGGTMQALSTTCSTGRWGLGGGGGGLELMCRLWQPHEAQEGEAVCIWGWGRGWGWNYHAGFEYHGKVRQCVYWGGWLWGTVQAVCTAWSTGRWGLRILG